MKIPNKSFQPKNNLKFKFPNENRAKVLNENIKATTERSLG